MNTDLKFIYFAPADIQAPRVDRQGIVHFCEALYRLGVDLELVTLRVRTAAKEPEHPLAPYRIRKRFPVHMVPTAIEQRMQNRQTVRVALKRLWIDSVYGLRFLRGQPRERTLVFFMKNYTPAIAFLVMRAFTRRRLMVVFEAHTMPKRFYQRIVLRRADGVVANSHALGRRLVQHMGLAADRVLGIHQGIDLELVEEARISKQEARRRLGLAADARVVVYAGKIQAGYLEVEYLLEAARHLPAEVTVLMVGGLGDDADLYREQAEREGIGNVRFTGFVPPLEVPVYLAAADVLTMYYPTGIELNSYRSPGKLFEYMAAERPVVSADFPVLREILGDDPAAVMVPPDAPRLLAAALMQVIEAPEQYAAMARCALERVRAFSWESRARRILEFIDRWGR